MKLLVDQNLSHRLPTRLSDLFSDSAQVRAAALERALDDQLWEYARDNGFCIVTLDSDFAERSGSSVRLSKSSGSAGSNPRLRTWRRCCCGTRQ